jgi:hypothetical protein
MAARQLAKEILTLPLHRLRLRTHAATVVLDRGGSSSRLCPPSSFEIMQRVADIARQLDSPGGALLIKERNGRETLAGP